MQRGPEDPDGDEIEGLACFSTVNRELIVLFGNEQVLTRTLMG